MNGLNIRHIESHDAVYAQQLVLAGLEEHWGVLDETQNPDLDDIPSVYAEGVFLVAELNGAFVGTGALIPEEPNTGRIVRMSVARAYRRQGIGRAILQALIREAGRIGYSRLVLETTATWAEAIAFYRRNGFRPVGARNGDIHFQLLLDESQYEKSLDCPGS